MASNAPKGAGNWPPSLRDIVQSVLALAVAGFVGAVMWEPLTSGSGDSWHAAQAIGAIVLPFLGMVLGYYFGVSNGAQLAQTASKQAEQAIEGKAEAKALSEEELADLRDELASARALLQTLRDAGTVSIEDQGNAGSSESEAGGETRTNVGTP